MIASKSGTNCVVEMDSASAHTITWQTPLFRHRCHMYIYTPHTSITRADNDQFFQQLTSKKERLFADQIQFKNNSNNYPKMHICFCFATLPVIQLTGLMLIISFR